jgi:sensor histidine kinase YesM
MNNEFPIARKKMYAVLFVANIFLSIFRLLILPELPSDFHVTLSIASLFGLLAIWEFILFVGKKLERKFSMTTKPNKRIIIQILVTYALAVIIGDSLIFASIKMMKIQFPAILQPFGYLLYFLLSIVMNLIYFGTIYFFNWKHDVVRIANLQREQAVVKYDALRNQLNPHFLFNALASLNSLIFENQQLASDFLKQLSKVYRYVLQYKEQETVSVLTEVDFISNYIFLLKTRFGNAVEFNVDVGAYAKTKAIVPVTLQILIENAMKHNVVSKESPLKLTISDDDAYLNIVNNINKKTLVETSNKQGLENLKSLYQYLTDKPIEIVEVNDLFKVRIPLI